MTRRKNSNRKPWLWMGGAVVLLALGGGGYYAMTPHGAASYYLDGEAQMKKGDVRAALIQFRNAVQRAPEDAKSRLALGQVLLLAGDPVSAEKELIAAKRLGVGADKITVPLAKSYLSQAKYEEVLKTAPAPEGTPEQQLETLILRGYADLGLRDFDGATQEFTAAIALRPDEPRAYIGMARVEADQGRIDKAHAPLDKALELAPKNAEALALKGEILRIGKHPDEALGYFAKALAVDPNQLVAHIGRAVLLIDEKKLPEAKKDVDAIIAVSPHHPVGNYLKALLLARENKTAEALDLLQKEPAALSYTPALYLQGALQLARNDVEQARTSLERYLREVPQDPRARLLLGDLLIKQGQAAQAVDILLPAAGSNEPQVLAALANAYLKSGDASKAQIYFDRAAAVSADDSQALTQVAMGRLQIGQSDAAIKDLERIVEKDPKAGPARVLLALTHLRRGELDQATALAKELQKQDPKSALPYNLFGAIAVAHKDLDGARDAFEKALEVQPNFTPARINLAQLELNLGHADKATAQYQAVLKTDKDDMGAMLGLANMAFAARKPAEGVNWLEKARDAHPKELQPRLRLVAAYLGEHDSGKALAAAQSMQLVAPNQPPALDAMGQAQLAAGKAADAVASFTQLAALLPKSPQAQQRLAAALLANKDEAGARRALEKALSLNPDYVAAVVDLIDMDLRAGDNESALKRATDWRAKHTDQPGVDALVGDVEARSGKTTAAIADYARELKNHPSSAAAVRHAQALAQSGDMANATKSLQGWLSAHKDDSVAYMALASFYLQQGNYKQAASDYEQSLKIAPDNPAAYNNLAWVYDKLGDSRAMGYAEKAYKAAPNSPAVADTYGYLLVKQGDKDRGVGLLRDAYAKAPQSGEIGYHLALGLRATGKTDEARDVLGKVLAGGDSFDGATEAKALYRELGGK